MIWKRARVEGASRQRNVKNIKYNREAVHACLDRTGARRTLLRSVCLRQDYPARPISLVSRWRPARMDVVARLYAEKLIRTLGGR